MIEIPAVSGELERLWRGEDDKHWKALEGVLTANQWDFEDFQERFAQRELLTRRYAWAVPSTEVILAIAAEGKIVEVGAGTGYWAHLLREAGARVDAYDRAPVLRNPWIDSTAYFPVARGGPRRLLRLNDRGEYFYADWTLLICWPPYASSMMSETIRAFPGNRLVFVGEGEGGCTGDDEGHRLLEEEWEEADWFPLPQWPGINDMATIYERKAHGGS